MILHTPFADIEHLGGRVRLDLPIMLTGTELVQLSHTSTCYPHLLGYFWLSLEISMCLILLLSSFSLRSVSLLLMLFNVSYFKTWKRQLSMYRWRMHTHSHTPLTAHFHEYVLWLDCSMVSVLFTFWLVTINIIFWLSSCTLIPTPPQSNNYQLTEPLGFSSVFPSASPLSQLTLSSDSLLSLNHTESHLTA